jgi:glycosidase
MTGAADPDNRRDMRWGDEVTPEESAHRERIAALVQLRQRLPALRHGTYETLTATDTLWVYRRDVPGQTVVVAINTGTEAAEVTASGAWPDAEDALDASAAVEGTARGLAFEVPAGGYRVVVQ